jgi:cytoskeleton protein RodZ
MALQRRYRAYASSQVRAPEDGSRRVKPRSAQGVGALLRAERERQDLSILEVAGTLRIRRVFLEALEEGHVDRLPGGTYAVAFVRAYADFLGLDRDEIFSRFRAEVEGIDQPVELVFPTPIAAGRLPGGALLAVSLVVAIGAYALWVYGVQDERVAAPRVTQVPPQLAALIEPTPSPQQAEAATMNSRTPRADSVKSGPGEDDVTAAAATGAATPAETNPQRAAGAGTSQASLANAPPGVGAETPIRGASPSVAAPSGAGMILRAVGDCWVRIAGPDGTSVFSRTLRPGETYAVPDRQGLTLSVGSAGALEIIVDGRVAPALGSVGQVRRDIALDPIRRRESGAGPPSGPEGGGSPGRSHGQRPPSGG